MSRRYRQRWRPLALAWLIALGASLALHACDSGDGGGSTGGGRTPGPGGSTRASGHVMKRTLPAMIDSNPQGFASADLLTSVANAWRTSSHRRFTQVEAGALASDKAVGALLIFRHEFVSAQQGVDVVKVLGAGPLTITHAPEGRRVEASAQRDGDIRFAGAAGVRGTLHLRNDGISLAAPRSPRD